MGKDVIIACDFPGKEETIRFLNGFGSERPFVKIGMELFYAAGQDMVKQLKDRGHKVFLDLKLCDIPNTVERAMHSLSTLGADIVNLHAFGGRAMMEAAMRGVSRPDGSRPLVIAVTLLTSISEAAMQQELKIASPLPETVLSYAENARDAGLDGVVCSPLESPVIHGALGNSFLTVTPGVRFADGDAGDQSRVATPARAKALTSDYIVVGRPITRAEDPVAAWSKCMNEFVL